MKQYATFSFPSVVMKSRNVANVQCQYHQTIKYNADTILQRWDCNQVSYWHRFDGLIYNLVWLYYIIIIIIIIVVVNLNVLRVLTIFPY